MPYFRWRQSICLAVYGTLIAVCTATAAFGLVSETTKAMALGVALPSLGILHWASVGQTMLVAGLFLAGVAIFVVALVVWFATGNLLAPLLVWALLAGTAGRPQSLGLEARPTSLEWHMTVAPILWGAAGLVWISRLTSPGLPRPRPSVTPATAVAGDAPAELSVEDLQRLRLLLDRALQPIDRFDGFEWRDQFQTAAIRYQVNFAAYTLAMVRHRYAPAADGYFAEAQRRLLGKIGDRRLWRYWRLENSWGRFRLGADPVPHDNIMYSGFTALQMALSGDDGDLVLHSQGRAWRRYTLEDIVALLDGQYRAARYGLLACEPNWIYPLCNLMSAAGIKAADARLGTARWQGLAAEFLASLQREGTGSDGGFLAFRSALTGIAPPSPGGIVMQTFPCLFLNCLDPASAGEHWERARNQMAHRPWRRLFWPVDVGNYGISRASGYAATAAAAIEMGDRAIAQECLQRLEAECPSRNVSGVIHRDRASLWAHALELMARGGGTHSLRDLTATAPRDDGPRLTKVDYPDVLVARARSTGRDLDLVLYPGNGAETAMVALGGLKPNRPYRTNLEGRSFLRADHDGCAHVRVPLRGRTCLTIQPMV